MIEHFPEYVSIFFQLNPIGLRLSYLYLKNIRKIVFAVTGKAYVNAEYIRTGSITTQRDSKWNDEGENSDTYHYPMSSGTIS